jgi:hypothetical protein
MRYDNRFFVTPIGVLSSRCGRSNTGVRRFTTRSKLGGGSPHLSERSNVETTFDKKGTFGDSVYY